MFRYMLVMEEIANRIAQFDEILMTDRQSRTLTTLHSIYRLQHDLLHLRILFNPLKEIIYRLQRSTSDGQFLPFPRTDPSVRLGINHVIVRRQPKTVRQTKNDHNNNKVKLKSIYLNDYTYVYLNNLHNHIDQVIDSLEIQRENVAFLISFWDTLTDNEIQEILNFLMLITFLFMPGILVTGMNATNFEIQPQYHFHYGYYITICFLALILIGIILWYKVKKWI